MKGVILFILVICCSLLHFACKEDPATKIPALEKALEMSGSKGAADSLVQLYQAAVKAHPEAQAANLHYLSKAANIRFAIDRDAVAAVRLANEAITNEGKGQNLTEPIGVLARIWYAYQYKSTPDLSRNPDDIDAMRASLEQNTPWIDSNLVRLDKALGGPAVYAKVTADTFIQIAEAYSTLIQTTNPDKHVDLLMKAAGLAKTVGNPNKALQLYYNVAEKMPQHPKAPTALFMMAFIYENDLKDLDKAKATYEKFLTTYPNDPDYVDDAQNALKFLGKSPEEIIRQFEKNPQ